MDDTQQSVLLQALAQRPATDVEGLLTAITADRWRQAQRLPVTTPTAPSASPAPTSVPL